MQSNHSKLMACFMLVCRLWMIGPWANLFGLVLMTLDHFIAIRWPLKHRILMSKRTVEIMIGCSWIFAVICGILYNLTMFTTLVRAVTGLLQEDTKNTSFDSFCRDWIQMTNEEIKRQRDASHYPIFFRRSLILLISIVLPTFISLLYMYTYIVTVVIKVTKRRRHFQRSSISSANQDTLNLRKRMRQARGIGTTITLLAAFLLLWTPVIVFYALVSTDSPILPPKRRDIRKIRRTMKVVLSCTTLVDIGIYFMRSKEAKRVLRPWFLNNDSRRSSGQKLMRSKL